MRQLPCARTTSGCSMARAEMMRARWGARYARAARKAGLCAAGVAGVELPRSSHQDDTRVIAVCALSHSHLRG